MMPQPIYPRERTPGTYEVGSWMSPRAVLGVLKKKKSRNGSVNIKLEVEKPPDVYFSLFGHLRRQSRLLALNSC